ncbi:ATP-binding protein [Paraglaciecola arctica]|uniref:ATP-binding protein n=1 Tax=Paraglaciecola arctica TaxID=1128911 RepID=UPI001C07E35D|nr:ATP-binding protein [Paraglaciecola arctica]MBU3004596.1 PAS domain S-box protein [Paraglaciecola arctica]
MNRFHLSKLGYIVGCLLILTLGLGTLWYSYLVVSKQVENETNTSLALQSKLKGATIEQTLLSSIRHTRFIYATPPVDGIVRALQHKDIDPIEGIEYALWVKRLKTIFLAYVKNTPDIVQIRFIGKANNGRELVRVHRHGDKIEVVPDDKLQQKNQRDYFQNVQSLPADQLYISEISLNREYGEIEQPPWPTYRIAQPVFDAQQQFFGLVIINFNAQLLLDKLTQHTDTFLELFLLNNQGQYLISPNKQQSFSFEYGDTSNWHDDTQAIVSSQVDNAKSHTIKFKATNTVFNISQHLVNMTVTSHVPPLTVITAINHQQMNQQIRQRYGTSVVFNVGLILLALVLLTLYRLYSHATFLRLKVQAEFEAIFQGSNDVIISLDTHGKIHSWNHAALTFFSVSEDTMENANIDQLVQHPQALTAIKQQISTIFSQHSSESLEVHLSSNHQTTRVMSIAFAPVYMGSSTVASVSAIFRDVTDASLLRQSLLDSNKKLESRNDEMQAFVYTVSHDLKSPLVTIGGFADRILDSAGDKLDEKNKHRLDRIRINVDHMAKLLGELLDLARIVKQKLKTDTCQLKTCIEKAQQSLNQSIVDSKASFEITNGDQQIQVNSQLLVQCLQNLFSNAINYAVVNTPPIIKINCFQKDDLLCIEIADNGMGIDPKHHDKIFKIFERLDVGNGSGVGLAIVKTIMEKHQGWVELKSAKGQGSTFTLCIPQLNQ